MQEYIFHISSREHSASTLGGEALRMSNLTDARTYNIAHEFISN